MLERAAAAKGAGGDGEQRYRAQHQEGGQERRGAAACGRGARDAEISTGIDSGRARTAMRRPPRLGDTVSAAPIAPIIVKAGVPAASVGGSLTDFMANDGKDVTNRGLDLNDFIGLSFATFTDESLINSPTSNSPTSVGSATTGSSGQNSRRRSRTNSVMNLACRSIGRRTKISATSSPRR
jgi:hypothetical protein